MGAMTTQDAANVEKLVGALGTAIDQPAYVCVRELLRFCATNRAELDGILRSAAGLARRKLRSTLAAVANEKLSSELFDLMDIGILQAEVRRHSRSHSPVLVAQALADAIDEAVGARFLGSMPEEMTVGPGDAFFVARPPIKQLFAAELNGNPDSYEAPTDATPRLRLLDRAYRYELRFSRKLAGALPTLGPSARIGFVLPNSGLSEFKVPDEPADRFFGVVPREEDRQLALITCAINWATENRLPLVLLPELSLSEAILTELKRRYKAAVESSSLPLLVAGSVHAVSNGEKRNRCTLLAPGGLSAEHDKLEPFIVKGRIEEICVGRHVTVHTSNEWSTVTLICKDFLPEAMLELLVRAAPSSVLVPAMSPTTDVFDANARHLATHVQAVVAVANATDVLDQATMYLGRPLRQDPIHLHGRIDTKHPVMIVAYVSTPPTHEQCLEVRLTDA